MKGYVTIEDENGMVRDLDSKAIVKTDPEELEAHRRMMRKRKAREQELNTLRDRVGELERQIEQILQGNS